MRAPLLLLGVLILCSVAVADRPNVLLILTDDQGYGDLSCTGNPVLKTPRLDALAKQSVVFDRFYVSPLCSPTRAALLTGRYPLRTGVWGVTRGRETMHAGEYTIAQALKSAGYATGIFGKWHNGEVYPYTPNGKGFDEFLGFCNGHWCNYFDTTLLHNGKPEASKGFITDVLTDAAMEFISANKGRPFFCYVPYNAPHAPFQAPDKYFDLFKDKNLSEETAGAYAMVASVDDSVGRLLDHLEKLKLAQSTIVIFMTDNGPNGKRFNGGMRGAKGSVHEGGSRVPFFLRYPARLKPRTVTQIAAHIDLFPTLAELCEVKVEDAKTAAENVARPLPRDGISLVPLLEGRGEKWPERTLFTHVPHHTRSPWPAAVRTGQWRAVREAKGGWQLYDMIADPGQEKDLASAKPGVLRKLSEAYDAHFAEVTKTAFPEIPLPVGYSQENPVMLPAPQASFTGSVSYRGRAGWAHDYLTSWTDAASTASWSIDVVAAGTYKASVLYSTGTEAPPIRLKLTVGAAGIESALRPAQAKQLPSPDRAPRKEAYEFVWAAQEIGRIALKKGAATLTIQAPGKPATAALEIKGVVLERVGD